MAGFRKAARQVMSYWGRQQTPQQGGFGDVFKQLQKSQEEARSVQEQRYKDILAQYENLGQAGRTRIQQQTAQQQAAATQGLISRGLGGTTITSAVGRGIASEGELQQQQLEESVAMQKAGVMERRTDVGPDMGMYANLLQTLAQGQAGGGRTIAAGGLGPLASRGLDIFGRKLGRFSSQATTGQPIYGASGNVMRYSG